ncbi:hypothetical protein L596_028618 [Steinernema carpocapsae]|uniref:Uncharacterized protein n=1 Tax=Steinernema carpocapsae TaxID=34508 RepID=A0A4U5LZ01_STECR|nr:hypothetical protein L596_028618 [Steinernema carpocapsae]
MHLKVSAILILATFFALQRPAESGPSCCLGKVGCILSCNAQNCATGDCEGGDWCAGTCVCNRCGRGSIGTVGISYGKKR